MHYVVLRDDDTNASTPVECLETLYRPFLNCGLPVNLSVIPAVRLDATDPKGAPEEFIWSARRGQTETCPMTADLPIVQFLRRNSGFHVVQHGYDHSCFEFDSPLRLDLRRRLVDGARILQDTGLGPTQAFVAPHDRLSREALREVAGLFRVISTGWFELRRIPWRWWPRYLLKKARRKPHWRAGGTLLLTHPGCLLSRLRPHETIVSQLKRTIESQRLTVLVTHWWEYFQDKKPDNSFISVLHQTATYLDRHPNIRVISFADLAEGKIPWQAAV